MVRQQLFIGAALIAGVAIGYFVQPEPVSPISSAGSEKAPARLIPDKGEAASVAALRARIRELEAQLATAHAGDEELVTNADERIEVARQERERRPEGPRAWLEDLKKKDPARYVQMTNNFVRWRQDRKERQAVRASFLSSVDTSHMSAGARRTHEDYQDLLARREALDERLQNPDLGDDERRELMDEMHAIHRTMQEAGAAECKLLLGEVARAVGLEGAAAEELVQTIGDVYEATEGNRRGFHMPPPPSR